MADFINSHLFCYVCGVQVTAGQQHECAFAGNYYVINSGLFHCAWCQTTAYPVAGYMTTTCSNCGHVLHGGGATPERNLMHSRK